MSLGPALPSNIPLLILLAAQAQGFQGAGAGVLEVLTALSQENQREDGNMR